MKKKTRKELIAEIKKLRIKHNAERRYGNALRRWHMGDELSKSQNKEFGVLFRLMG